MKLQEKIVCPECHSEFKKEDLKRNCSNCFACTGCEVYICSSCKARIVVIPPRPYKKSNKGKSDKTANE